MTTSSFRIAGTHVRAVAISRSVPSWYRGRRFMLLAPGWSLVRMKDAERFERLYYERVLAPLDPWEVIAEVGVDAVLLCWERPNEPCHRRLVGRWLWRETGLYVREWRRAR